MQNLFWFDNVELRPHPWPGLNWVTTVLPVPDVKKTRDLYVTVFGFVPIFDFPDPKNPDNFMTSRLRYRGTNILLSKELDAPTSNQIQPRVVFYLYVDDVDAVCKKGQEHGMEWMVKPEKTPWGDYRARLRCPDGYVWDVASRI